MAPLRLFLPLSLLFSQFQLVHPPLPFPHFSSPSLAHQFLIRIIGNNKKEETRLKNKKEKGKKRGRDERREKRGRGGREEKNSFAVGNGEHERTSTSTTLNKEEMSKDGRGERIEETRTERGKGPGKRRECRQTEQPENVWAADDESVGNRAPGDLPANC